MFRSSMNCAVNIPASFYASGGHPVPWWDWCGHIVGKCGAAKRSLGIELLKLR
jgi:hypothetical protein